jgi:hypothetical protein
MSNSVGRRDTLKLAGAAAALGAGLGMVLKAADALADVPHTAAPLPGKTVAPRLIIGPEVQIKIDALHKLPVPAGSVQWKISSAAGQFLYAANMPTEIAKLIQSAPGGQVQLKFFRGTTAAPTVASEPFGEGLIQLLPSTGQR